MNERIFSVSEVNRLLKTTIENMPELINIQIAGEISNFKKYASGHCYFTLKDSSSALKAVMFKGRTFSLKFAPKDGDKVIAIGKISVYERDGAYQLYTDLLFMAGIGDLMIKYEALKTKLTDEGIFLSEKKKDIPSFVKKLGVITSASGAAVHDIMTVAKRRNPGVKIYLLPVTVQGNDAKYEIVKAIEFFNKAFPVDVLIIGRGGGSLEDLWAFNEEIVVRAVATSQIPTISAVGHETDFTLMDFAADCRAATPSQAAEIAVFNVGDYLKKAENLSQRNIIAFKYKYQTALSSVERLANTKVMTAPQRYYNEKEMTLDNLSHRLSKAIDLLLQQSKYKQALLSSKLEANSPLGILSKGYVVLQKEDSSEVVKSVSEVDGGMLLTAILLDGKIISEVKKVEGGKKLNGSQKN